MEVVRIQHEGKTVALRVNKGSLVSDIVVEACRVLGVPHHGKSLSDGDHRRPLPHSVSLSALPLKQFTLVQGQIADARNPGAATIAPSTPTVPLRAASRLPSTRAVPIVPPLSLSTEHAGNAPPRAAASTPSAGLSIRVFASTPAAGVSDTTYHSASMSSVAPAPYTLQERVLSYCALDVRPILTASHELFVRLQQIDANRVSFGASFIAFSRIALAIADKAPTSIPRPTLVCPVLPIRVALNIVGTVLQSVWQRFAPEGSAPASFAPLLAASRLESVLRTAHLLDTVQWHPEATSSLGKSLGAGVEKAKWVGFVACLVAVLSSALELGAVRAATLDRRRYGVAEIELLFDMSPKVVQVLEFVLPTLMVRFTQVEQDIVRRLQSGDLGFLPVENVVLSAGLPENAFKRSGVDPFLSFPALMQQGDMWTLCQLAASASLPSNALVEALAMVAGAYEDGSAPTISFHRAMTCLADLGIVRLLQLPLSTWQACWLSLQTFSADCVGTSALPSSAFANLVRFASFACWQRRFVAILQVISQSVAIKAAFQALKLTDGDAQACAIAATIVRCSPALNLPKSIAPPGLFGHTNAFELASSSAFASLFGSADSSEVPWKKLFMLLLAPGFSVTLRAALHAAAASLRKTRVEKLTESRSAEVVGNTQWPRASMLAGGKRFVQAYHEAAIVPPLEDLTALSASFALAVCGTKIPVALLTVPDITTDAAVDWGTQLAALENHLSEFLTSPGNAAVISAALSGAPTKKAEAVTTRTLEIRLDTDACVPCVQSSFSGDTTEPSALSQLLQLAPRRATSALSADMQGGPTRHGSTQSFGTLNVRPAVPLLNVVLPSSIIVESQHAVGAPRVRLLPNFQGPSVMKSNNSTARAIAAVQRALMLSSLARRLNQDIMVSNAEFSVILMKMLSEISGVELETNPVIEHIAPALQADIFSSVELAGMQTYSVTVLPDIADHFAALGERQSVDTNDTMDISTNEPVTQTPFIRRARSQENSASSESQGRDRAVQVDDLQLESEINDILGEISKGVPTGEDTPSLHTPKPLAAAHTPVSVSSVPEVSKPLFAKLRKLCAWLAPAHALGRLERVIHAVAVAREKLLVQINSSYVWDYPMPADVPDQVWQTMLANGWMGESDFAQFADTADAFHPMQCIDAIDIFRHTKSHDVMQKDVTSVTWAAAGSLAPLSDGEPVARSAICWAEYHVAMLYNLEAECLLEVQQWTSMTEDMLARQAAIATMAEPARPEVSTLHCQVIMSASDVEVDSFVGNGHEIDQVFAVACRHLERSAAMRPAWPVARECLAQTLSRRSLLSYSVLIQASADQSLEKAFTLPISAPEKLLGPTADEQLQFHSAAHRRLPAFVHARPAALSMLHAALLVVKSCNNTQLQTTLEACVLTRGCLAGNGPLLPQDASGTGAQSVRLISTGFSAADANGPDRQITWYNRLAIPTCMPFNVAASSEPSAGAPILDIASLSVVGQAAVFRLFKEYDDDGDGCLKGFELVRLFEDVGLVFPSKPSNAKASRNFAVMHSWFAHNFSCGYLGSDADPYCRIPLIANLFAHSPKQRSPVPEEERHYDSPLTVVAWACDSNKSTGKRRQRQAFRAYEHIMSEQQTVGSFEPLWSVHIAGAISSPFFSGRGPRALRRRSLFPDFLLQGLQRESGATIVDIAPRSAPRCTRRIPSNTHYPDSNYSVASCAVTFPAFCEFVVWLLCFDPWKIMQLMYAQGVLAEDDQPEPAPLPPRKVGRTVSDSQLIRKSRKLSNSFGESESTDGSVVVHSDRSSDTTSDSGEDASEPVGLPAVRTARGMLPTWASAMQTVFVWRTTSLSPSFTTAEASRSRTDSFRSSKHPTSSYGSVSTRGDSSDDGTVTSSSVDTTLGSVDSEASPNYKMGALIDGFSDMPTRTHSRTQSMDHHVLSVAWELPGAARASKRNKHSSRRARAGTGTSASKTTPRLHESSRRNSGTSTRSGASAASSARLTRLKAANQLGLNFFSSASTPSTALTPAQLKMQMQSRRKLAAELLESAGLFTPRDRSQNVPRAKLVLSPDASSADRWVMPLQEDDKPATSSLLTGLSVPEVADEFDYSADEDEDLFQNEMDSVPEPMKHAGRLKLTDSAEETKSQALLVDQRGRLVVNDAAAEELLHQTETHESRVSEAHVLRLAKSSGLSPQQTKSLYLGLCMQHQANQRRQRLGAPGSARKRLFDYFVVAGRGDIIQADLDVPLELQLSNSTGPEDLDFLPVVFDRLPTDDWPGTSMPANVAGFAFPLGLKLSTVPRPTTFFYFVLTSESGTKLFCCAMTRWEKMDPLDVISMFASQSDGMKPGKSNLCLPPWLDITQINSPTWIGANLYTPKALILMSHHPLFSTMKAVLCQVLRLSVTAQLPIPMEKYLAHAIFDVPLPPRGYASIGMTIGDRHFVVARPPANQFPLLDMPLFPLFQCLDVNNLLLVFAAMLCERRVCVCSKHLQLLTPVVEALASLLFPFKWIVNYIPVLPQNHKDIIGAPTPYIIGWCGEVKEAQPYSSDAVFIDLDANTVHTPLYEPVPKLPEAQRKKLVNALKEHAYGSSPSGMLGMFGGRTSSVSGKLYGADYNPDLRNKLAMLERAFPTVDKKLPGMEQDPADDIAVVSSPAAVSFSYFSSASMDPKSEAPGQQCVAMLKGPWLKKRSHHHYSGSIDLQTLPDRAPSKRPEPVTVPESSVDPAAVAGMLSSGWLWSSPDGAAATPAEASDFPTMRSPTGVTAHDSISRLNSTVGALSLKETTAIPSGHTEQFRIVNMPVEVATDASAECTPVTSSSAATQGPTTNSPESGSDDASTLLPTSVFTGLSAAFNPSGIRSAFLKFFMSLFKHYREYVVYEQVGTHSVEHSAKQVRALLVRAARHKRMLQGIGITDPTQGAEVHKFPTEAQSPSSGDSDALTTEIKTAPAAGAASSTARDTKGVHVPPLPLPAIRAVFNIDGFLFDHTSSRDFVRVMHETQLFSGFLRSLVPLFYSFDPMVSPPPYNAFPAPVVIKPLDVDPYFFSRLPSSIKLFNASINAKLNRLAANRMTVPGFRPRWTKLDTSFIDDQSSRIHKHITIPPPLPLGLPADVAQIVSKMQAAAAATSLSAATMQTPAISRSKSGNFHSADRRGRALSSSVDTIAAAALASAGMTARVRHGDKHRVESKRPSRHHHHSSSINAEHQPSNRELRKLQRRRRRHRDAAELEVDSPPRRASDTTAAITAHRRHKRTASGESVDSIARQVANAAPGSTFIPDVTVTAAMKGSQAAESADLTSRTSGTAFPRLRADRYSEAYSFGMSGKPPTVPRGSG